MAVLQKVTVKGISTYILPLVLFFLLSCVATFPLIFHLHEMIPGLGDQLLVSWIMNWDIHALLHDPLHLFNANIFYPYKNTLAYSDVFITSALLSFLPLLILKQPVVAYSWTLLLSLTLLAYCTYLLTNYVTKNTYASFISGVLVSFCVFTIGKISVLQLVSIYFVPLSLLFFLLFFDTRYTRYFILFCITFLLQIYNSFLPGYFIVFSVVILLLFHRQRKQIVKQIFSLRYLCIIFITGLLMLPIIIPYYLVSKEFEYVRDIRDTIAFANRVEFSFYPPDTSILHNDIISLFYEHNTNPLIYFGYVGLLFYLLLIFSVVYLLYSRDSKKLRSASSFITIAVFGLVLSLGPALQWGQHIIKKPFIIPLPYVLFYYLLPGFKGMRNSGRWEMLFVFAACVGIGIVLSRFFTHKKLWFKAVFTILVVLGTMLELNIPLAFNTIEKTASFPKVYSYLATLPSSKSIIELPLYSWYMVPYSMQEFKREYYSTIHFLPMVNGYSGFSPPEWEKRSDLYMQNFPDEKTVEYLKTIGIDYLVLHKKEYETLEKNSYTIHGKKITDWKNIQFKLDKFTDIKKQTVIGDDYVYKIIYK